MRWGLPPPAHDIRRRSEKPRPTVWFREIWPSEKDLLEPAARCLIIVDSFALPDGLAGARTRTWYGYDERPIFAWAGVWRAGVTDKGFAGAVVPAAPPISPLRTMPALVDGHEYESWLRGELLESSALIRRSPTHPELYREATEQPWGADTTL